MSIAETLGIDALDLRPKLIAAFVLVALLVGATGVVGYQSLGTLDHGADLIAQDGQDMDHAAEMLVAIEKQQVAVQAAQLGESGARADFDDAKAMFGDHSAAMDVSGDERAKLEALRSTHEEYDAHAAEYFQARNAGNDELAAQKLAEMDALRGEMEGQAHELEELAQADMAAQGAAVDRTTRTARTQLLALTVVAFLAAIGLGLLLNRHITPPIKRLSESAAAISDGDLDADIVEHDMDDEIGRMVDAFGEMQRNLTGVFGDLGDVSRNLKRGTLDHDIDTTYPGTYGAIMTDLDEGTDQLTGSFHEIEDASQALRSGRLDRTVDADRPGQYGAVLEDFQRASDRLAESFGQISTVGRNLKRGRLDRSIDAEYPGEYGSVLADLGEGVAQLRASVRDVQTVADDVATTSTQVAASTEEIEAASEDVADSVEEISRGASKQSGDLDTVASEMNDMSATVEEIASSAEEVAATAGTAVDRGETGRERAGEARREIAAIESQADEASTQVQALDEEMVQIGEIVGMIAGIAEQTNMLALNA